MREVLAIDIGASSGRHIVGWWERGQQRTREVHRFKTGTTQQDGHLVWDVERIFREIKTGIRLAFEEFGALDSLSIDTWGVDYVLLRGEEELRPCYAYRDSRTDPAQAHRLIPFRELYRRTGCQFQPFNTVYQLCDDLKQGRLEAVTDFLMLPEYFIWRLTGVKVKEYTNATTTGLVNGETGAFDREIIAALGLPDHLFPPLSQPGTVVGKIKDSLAAEVGGRCQVVLCATHDTASAVEGVPMEENCPYLSSGTWSLLGLKTKNPLTDQRSMEANWSNEGGVGYNRYQKNIMGLWLANAMREELGPGLDFDHIVQDAKESRYDGLVDANDPAFLAPASMSAAIQEAVAASGYSPPKYTGDLFRCAYRSLAVSYRDALAELERNTGQTYDTLYIVGGGASNQFLNDLTAQATGKRVVALPIEASALGNIKIQQEIKWEGNR